MKALPLRDEGMKELGEFIDFIKEEIKNKTIRKIEVQEEEINKTDD